MARVHFGSGIVHELYYAIHTELEALKESPELTVQLKLFGT